MLLSLYQSTYFLHIWSVTILINIRWNKADWGTNEWWHQREKMWKVSKVEIVYYNIDFDTAGRTAMNFDWLMCTGVCVRMYSQGGSQRSRKITCSSRQHCCEQPAICAARRWWWWCLLQCWRCATCDVCIIGQPSIRISLRVQTLALASWWRTWKLVNKGELTPRNPKKYIAHELWEPPIFLLLSEHLCRFYQI